MRFKGLNATEAYTRLKYLRSSFIFKITLKVFIFMIELKDDIDFCDEIDVTFSMGCVQYQSKLFTLQIFWFWKWFFYFSLVLLVEISNSCVFGVDRENIYLLSFVALVVIMMTGTHLLYKYFFSYILISLKKVFTKNAMEYLKWM